MSIRILESLIISSSNHNHLYKISLHQATIMSIIEIGCMGVKPDHAVMDSSTDEGRILQQAWGSVVHADGGPHWAYGGLECDDPLRLWGLFSFDSVQQHEKFAQTQVILETTSVHVANLSSFGFQAVKDLPKILNHPIFQRHVAIDDGAAPLAGVLDAGIVRMIFAYFPSDVSEDNKVTIRECAKKVLAEHGSEGSRTSWGWGVENDFPILGDEDEGKGSAFVIFQSQNNQHGHSKEENSSHQALSELRNELRAVGKLLHVVSVQVRIQGFR